VSPDQGIRSKVFSINSEGFSRPRHSSVSAVLVREHGVEFQGKRWRLAAPD
jgi:hypothetical protein